MPTSPRSPATFTTEASPAGLAKVPTGCAGLDEITGGGLPAGRPTLVCGGPGCGKTVLGMEFLVRGAIEHGEPGLLVSFEESPRALAENFASLSFDVDDLIDRGLLKILHVDLSSGELLETGDFSLDGLVIRLAQAIAEIGAKRVVLDTLEALFSVLDDSTTLRREVAGLFHWFRERGLTVLVTAERGVATFTRHGFEEYVSDCVLLLDHRVVDQVSKRRLRVLKYRGSAHGADEYPFIITGLGLSVVPITSSRLDYSVGTERISSGVPDLDDMLGGEGYLRGSTILVSGQSGSGKSALGGAFVAAACRRGERALYVSSEESGAQVVRNMASLGIDLEACLTSGLLGIEAFRPSSRGLEEHLFALTATVERHAPDCVVLDAISNFIAVGDAGQVKSMLTRFVDVLKSRGTTVLLTELTSGGKRPEETDTDISSLSDTWLAVQLETDGASRRRSLYVVKSRGMDHELGVRRFVLSSGGLSLPQPADVVTARGEAAARESA